MIDSVLCAEVRAIREDSPRWEQVNPSGFTHEQEGLRELASYLPDADPFHAWTNIEFIATDGSINEVDALVLTENGLYVLELKHWEGEIRGDGTQWVRRVGKRGRLQPWDNPLILANRKAKRLAGLIQHYARQQGKATRVPFVRAAIFLHARNMRSLLDSVGRKSVYGLDGQPGLPSLKSMLLARPNDSRDLVDPVRGKEILDLIRGAKIRRSVAERKIGSLLVHPRPFAEGVGWQDFLAGHVVDKAILRRVRFYLTSRAEPDDVPVIERAASREFRLLQGMRHDGIAAAVDMAEHQWGPAVIFEHDERWVRFDQWLVDRSLTLAQKLQLVQDLAEIMEYAHARRLVHRSLHPKAIFVKDPDEVRPRLVITDWQTSGQLNGGTRFTRLPSSLDSAGLEMFYDDEARRYQAPEAFVRGDAPGAALDVFSLGVIAYRIFAAAAPATSGEDLIALVREGGLNLAAAMEGAPYGLVELIYKATCGDPALRIADMSDFRAGVEAVWDQLTAPEPVPVVDPLEAKRGDVLDGGLTVIKSLGSGATAKALLVHPAEDSSRKLVLKVAKNERHAERLREEGRVLSLLQSHWQVAALVRGDLIVGTRTALLLENAGETTLAKELQSGPLAIDLLERYGRDLLDVLSFLDGQGVTHRDIKPANLAARPRPKDRQLHLCVFDFSLASVPADQLTAGTPGYLDPFLGAAQRRPRYDSAAEWFSAAVTLYEMATGKLPRWGEGANPAVVKQEVTLAAADFDRRIADRLIPFFAKALARDTVDRYDTIEEMTDAWRLIFKDIPEAGPSELPGPPAADVTRESPLEATELTARAQSALNRLGVHTVGELLDSDAAMLNRAKGVPNATRKEIVAQLRLLRTHLLPAGTPAPDAVTARGIEALSAVLLPKATSRNKAEREAMAVLLGQAPAHGGEFLRWPAQSEAARATGQNQPQLSAWLRKHAAAWVEHAALSPVRDEIVALLDTRGAVLSAEELAHALIADRGSYSDEPRRTAQAIGVVRAAVEAELSRGGNSRVAIRRFRTCDSVLIGREPDDPAATTTAADLLDYAVELGKRAAVLAENRPQPTKHRTLSTLREVAAPNEMPGLDDARLVQLAAAASSDRAAVDAQGLLYPVGMPAEEAVRLSANSLVGQTLNVERLHRLITARFPRAQKPPQRPALDDLLERCGVPLRWDQAQQMYASTTMATQTGTRLVTTIPVLDSTSSSSEVDARLRETLRNNGFLVLLAQLKHVDAARRELLRRQPLTEVNITGVMLGILRDSTVPWELIVAADGRDANHADFQALRTIIKHDVMRAITVAIDAAPGAVLLTEAAPLARYDEMGLLRQLADTGRVRPAARLLLTPYRRPEQPMLDDVPVPLISRDSQALHLPEAWINADAMSAAEERKVAR